MKSYVYIQETNLVAKLSYPNSIETKKIREILKSSAAFNSRSDMTVYKVIDYQKKHKDR